MDGSLNVDLLLLLSVGELWLLLACPSPPGSAPGARPSPPSQLLVACPSPPGQGLLHLATFFSFQGFNPLLVYGFVWWWCENCGVLLVTVVWPNGCVPIPSVVHCFLLLNLPSCCGDDTPHSVSMTELLVSCLPVCVNLLRTDPRLSLTCDTRAMAVLTHFSCVLQILKNKYYTWLNTTQWCIGKLFCPSLRVKC
jgi:hypothetical protein